MKNLTENEIKQNLRTLPGWVYLQNSIQKTFHFDRYMDGISFVNKVALKAEELNHHPDLTVGWCKIKVSYSTHDVNGVTENDVNMAKLTDKILSSV